MNAFSAITALALALLVGCSGARVQHQQPTLYPLAVIALFDTPAPIGDRIVMVDTLSLQKLHPIDQIERYVLSDLADAVGRSIQAKPPAMSCEPGRVPCRLPGDPFAVTVLNASRGNGTARIEVRYEYNLRLPDGEASLTFDDVVLELRRERSSWALVSARRVAGH